MGLEQKWRRRSFLPGAIAASALSVCAAALLREVALGFSLLGAPRGRPSMGLVARSKSWDGRAPSLAMGDGAEDHSIEALSVTELKDQLKAAGLKATGKKPELVARLEEHMKRPLSEEALNAMSAADLKKRAKAAGLAVTGGKAALVERILGAQGDEGEEDEEEEAPKKATSKKASSKKATKKATAKKTKKSKDEEEDEEEEEEEVVEKKSTKKATAKKTKKSKKDEEEEEEEVVEKKTSRAKASKKAKKKADEEEEEEEAEEAEEEEEEEEETPTQAKVKVVETKARGKKAAAKVDASEGFRMGDTVDALYAEEEKDYEAIIQRDMGDGNWLITWTEDDCEYMSNERDMKLKSRTPAESLYQPGQAVDALYEDEDKWYEAHVVRNLGDGSYIVSWDEDQEWATVRQEDQMKLPPPLIPIDELEVGQKYKGKVEKTHHFGTFINFGAERAGLMRPWFMVEDEFLEDYEFQKGDKVKALFDHEEWGDNEMYEATIAKKRKKDGSYAITWDEDESEDVSTADKMELQRVAKMDEDNDEGFDVYISSLLLEGERAPQVGVSLVKGKVGERPPRPRIDWDSWEMVRSEEWLTGTVQRVLDFGAFVQAKPNENARPATGLVHVTNIRDGFVSNVHDELEVGQEVSVRLVGIDREKQQIKFTMVG